VFSSPTPGCSSLVWRMKRTVRPWDRLRAISPWDAPLLPLGSLGPGRTLDVRLLGCDDSRIPNVFPSCHGYGRIQPHAEISSHVCSMRPRAGPRSRPQICSWPCRSVRVEFGVGRGGSIPRCRRPRMPLCEERREMSEMEALRSCNCNCSKIPSYRSPRQQM
jgi:hypothetical protein